MSIDRRSSSWTIVGLMVFVAASSAAAAAADPLAVIRERFVRSVLPSSPADVEAVHWIAAKYADGLGPEGKWSDLAADDNNPAFWSGGTHLGRALLMAKSARLRKDAGKPDPRLLNGAIAALRAWTGPDLQNRNWWWNRIGVPELVAEIACIIWDDLPSDQREATIRIVGRSDMKGMTGANLTWCAINQVLLGVMRGDESVTRAAYDRLYEEVCIAGVEEEGIQADFSFHQHGKQFYNGGYGLFYANDVGRFVYVAHGTPFQAPDEERAIFDGYMLDGMRWMTRRDALDYNTMGRVITRVGVVAAPSDWSLGPISPAGPAYSMGNVVRLLAELPGPRQREYAAYAADLAGAADAPPFEGSKHFWRSDYTSHARKGYLTTVKMFSTRINNAEVINREGRLSHHLSDGANFLYITGDEYRDVFPAWDWQKVPGTTAEQVPDLLAKDAIEPNAITTRGKTTFVGGASDGTYGASAMDLQRGALSARKGWFFFDDVYVCLGAGITITSENPVVTSINQCRLRGEVAGEPSGGWLHHDRVGYVFDAGANVRHSASPQNGRWSDIGMGPDEPVSIPVFSLWIDHGKGSRDASYAYAVLPAATAEQTRSRAASPTWKVVNTAKVQAVAESGSGVMSIVFWEPGRVASGFGEVEADQPCIVIVRGVGEQTRVTVSNPKNDALDVVVRLGSREAKVKLPGGDRAGSSVTSAIR